MRHVKEREIAVRRRVGLTSVLLSLVVSGCGGPVAYVVDDGVYGALVPSVEQFAVDSAQSIPGGFGVAP